MPLVSQGGGRVRTSPLTSYTPGHAPTSLGIRRPRAGGFLGRGSWGIQKTTTSVPSAIRKASRSVSGSTKATGSNVPSTTGGGGVQDPFKFIQGLLSNMDPAKAQALVDQIYAPLRQQINDQIAQSQGLALARANQMKDVYGAFAQYMGGLQGNLQSIYQAGRSDGNALASGMAGPGGDVAAHLDTMAGIQNTMLGAEAKGWGDFGASMPGVYSLMATQNVKNMLNAATADQATLRSKLLELSSQEASDVLKYLNDAQAKDVQLKEWAYGQRQSQQAGLSSQTNSYLNYLQKNSGVAYNNAIIAGQTPAQAQAAANNTWRRGIASMRASGLITAAQAKQMLGLGAGMTYETPAAATQHVSVGLSKTYGYLVDTTGNPILQGGKTVQLPSSGTAGQSKPSVGLSKMFGYLVDQYGNPIRSNGKTVPIPTKTPTSKPPKVNTALSAAYGVLTDQYGNPILRNGKTVPYKPYTKPGSGKGGTAPGSSKYNTALASAQKYIQNDISTRKWKNQRQAELFYLHMYGGIRRAGGAAGDRAIIKFVDQAWSTRIPKAGKGKGASSGGLGGGYHK